MSCRPIRNQLTAFLLNDLDPAQAAHVRAHLASCPACQAEADTLKQTLDVLTAALAAPGQEPAQLDPWRHRVIRAAAHAPRPRRAPRRIPAIILEAAAGLAIVCTLWALMLPKMSGKTVRMRESEVEVTILASEETKLDEFQHELEKLEDISTIDQLASLPASSVADSKEIQNWAFIDTDVTGDVLSDDAVGYVKTPPSPTIRFYTFSTGRRRTYERDETYVAGKPADRSAILDQGVMLANELAVADARLSSMDDVTVNCEAPPTLAGESGLAGALAGTQSGTEYATLDIRNDSSPVVMHGLLSSRSAEGRAAMLGKYGGGYGGAAEAAVISNLQWLQMQQNKDGSWNHANPAATSLGLLAFLAHGETPASPGYGETVEKALRYLTQQQADSGQFSVDPQQQAQAVYALAEAFAMTRIPVLREAVAKGVTALEKQASDGLDLPTARWASMALYAAADAGVTAEGADRLSAAASRQLEASPDPVDVLGLTYLGQRESEAGQAKLAQLPQVTYAGRQSEGLDVLFMLTQAKFQAGGAEWAEWNRAMAPDLVKRQEPGGSMRDPARPDQAPSVQSTALAALMKSVYYRFLPSFRPIQDPASTNDEVGVEIIRVAVPTPAPTPTPVPTAQPRAASFNPWVETAKTPLSTFGIDVDTASYTIARRYINAGFRPPPELVRTEEFVNYFDYQYLAPQRQTFAIYPEVAPALFGPGYLLKIGVKGREIGRDQRPVILTLAIDTSGSMNTPDRLDLIKQSLALLVAALGPADQVAIVQYGAQASLVLAHTALGTNRAPVLAAIDALQAGTSTHLEKGVRLAYEVAARGFTAGAENRVILMSDGVANLGSGKAEDILALVAQYRDQGIFCSIFGFGAGSYDDTMLETLANKGDGVYRYLDSLDEARRELVDGLAATLHFIARDVKIQVEFNPQRVAHYRQLGYENRRLRPEDFRDDAVDAGEVGSGQSVTALYELDLAAAGPDPLATVRVRYHDLASGRIEEIAMPVTSAHVMKTSARMPPRFKLAAAAAAFAELLRGSPFAEGYDFAAVAQVLRPVAQELNLDPGPAELARLVQAAAGLPCASE